MKAHTAFIQNNGDPEAPGLAALVRGEISAHPTQREILVSCPWAPRPERHLEPNGPSYMGDKRHVDEQFKLLHSKACME